MLCRLKANRNVSCTRPLLTALISVTLFSVLCSDRFSGDLVQGHLVLPPFLRWMCHCILGKASLAMSEGPQDEPCPQMAQVSGLSPPQDILIKLKQRVIQLQGPSGSCEKELVALPTGSLDFRQELWRQELQGLMTHLPSSAGPAVGDKTYLWDIATVLDSQFHWIQKWAKLLTFSFSSWK